MRDESMKIDQSRKLSMMLPEYPSRFDIATETEMRAIINTLVGKGVRLVLSGNVTTAHKIPFKYIKKLGVELERSDSILRPSEGVSQ